MHRSSTPANWRVVLLFASRHLSRHALAEKPSAHLQRGNAPRSLRDDEVYAVCAYILQLNGIISENAVMNAQTLAKVQMPNREGFVPFSRQK